MLIEVSMKRDGRKLDHRTLEEIRKMAVERVREGEKPSTRQDADQKLGRHYVSTLAC